jgi:hypothetical protein
MKSAFFLGCTLSLIHASKVEDAPVSIPTECNPRDNGAQGDGVHDDTVAFAECISSGSPSLFVPSGNYVITSTLTSSSELPFTIRGDGFVSNILWTENSDLFLWNTSNPVSGILIDSITVSSVGNPKSPSSTAFHFTAGVVKSLFSGLLFYGAGAPPIGSWQPTLSGTNLDLGGVTDTV